MITGVEHPKAKPVQAGGPKFAGRQWSHHIRPVLAQQFVNRRDLVSARPYAVDDHGQRSHCFGAVPSAIVHQHDIPAAQIFLAAGRQMRQHIGRDLFGRRILAPVVGIDPIADGDIAHFLRNLERTHLVGGVRLLVDRVRRPHQSGADAYQAGEEPLREVQLHFHYRRSTCC